MSVVDRSEGVVGVGRGSVTGAPADRYDAVVVGSGPNGLAAAITLARAGCSVAVFEAKGTPGGAARTQELTLPGFLHDVGSAIHPLAVGSPFFRDLPLAEHGLEWIHPDVPLAHPFDDGSAAVLERSFDATVAGLGVDAGGYRRLMGPPVRDWERLLHEFLGPLRPPRYPFAMASFGLRAGPALPMRLGGCLEKRLMPVNRIGTGCHNPIDHIA